MEPGRSQGTQCKLGYGDIHGAICGSWGREAMRSPPHASQLKAFLFSGSLFDCVPFSSLLLQELSMCLQPVLLGFCIKEGLMYPFCLPRGRHLHICHLLCLHSSLDSQPILFYFGITQWSKRDIREAMRKAVGERKKEEAQMVPRVLNDWESLYRGD